MLQVYVLEKHKVIISHIPKSGVQSLRVLTFIANNDPLYTKGKFNDLDEILWDYFDKHYVRTNVQYYIDLGFQLVSVVRNPYSRLVSAYVNKILGLNFLKSKRYQSVVQIMEGSESNRISFEKFIEYLENNNLNIDPHWDLQTNLAGHGNFESVVLNLENTKDIVNFFVRKTRTSYPYYKPKDHLTKVITHECLYDKGLLALSKYLSNGEQPDWRCFYSNDLASRVFKLYRKDFINYGYDKTINNL